MLKPSTLYDYINLDNHASAHNDASKQPRKNETETATAAKHRVISGPELASKGRQTVKIIKINQAKLRKQAPQKPTELGL